LDVGTNLVLSRLAVVTFDDGYRDTFTTAFPILSGHNIPFTLYVSTERIGSGDERFLDWDQIGIMLESGLLTIGSHTHTHADLRHLDEEEILDEIGEADNIIQRRLGIAPDHFAYPWGYWSEPADRIVRERYDSAALGAASRAGFWHGCSSPSSFPGSVERRKEMVSDEVERRLRS
jgi:peptidoglycan/xylan/chitin deacetylase (PgdA/CDA1 family)